jgi:EmrB/QacA subfamily drug resistance transporter
LVQPLSNFRSTFRSTAIAFLVAGAFFMQSIDATMIATAMPAMARSFSVDAVDIGLGISAYLLALAVLIPVSGWVADRLGPRKVFAAAVVVFTLASILCGASHGLYSFVAARVLQGAGGAMMVPVGRLVVLNNTPREKLIGAIAALTWPALMAPVLGPPLGGVIAVHFGWRWIFWVNVPLGIVAVAAAVLLIPGDIGKVKLPFDWLGFLLTGAAIICLMCGAEMASLKRVLWHRVIALVATGFVLMVGAIRHLKRCDHPMVALSALRVKTFAVTMYGGSLFRMSISAVPFVLPLMFQLGFGYDPIYSGLLVMAVFAGNIAMKPATTPIMRRFGFKPVLVTNGVLNALLVLACVLITPASPRMAVVALLLAGGLTRSMQFTALNTLAFADIERSEISGANTLFSAAFQLSWGMGVVLGAVCIRLAGAGVRLIQIGAMAGSPGIEFRLSFVLLGIVCFLGIVDSIQLDRNAGEAVSKGPAQRSLVKSSNGGG